jgi:hypothetical protein
MDQNLDGARREIIGFEGGRSLHALEFAGSEVGVGALVQAWEELGPEAGALRRRDVPVGYRRKRSDELLVPAGIVGPD